METVIAIIIIVAFYGLAVSFATACGKWIVCKDCPLKKKCELLEKYNEPNICEQNQIKNKWIY